MEFKHDKSWVSNYTHLYCSFPLTSWVFTKVYCVLFYQGAEAQQEPAADNYYNEARLISDLFLTNPDADVIRLLRPPGDNNGTGPFTVYLGYPSLILSNVDEKSGYITLSLSESTVSKLCFENYWAFLCSKTLLLFENHRE